MWSDCSYFFLDKKVGKKSRPYIQLLKTTACSATSTPTRKRHYRLSSSRITDDWAHTGVRQRFTSPCFLQVEYKGQIYHNPVLQKAKIIERIWSISFKWFFLSLTIINFLTAVWNGAKAFLLHFFCFGKKWKEIDTKKPKDLLQSLG